MNGFAFGNMNGIPETNNPKRFVLRGPTLRPRANWLASLPLLLPFRGDSRLQTIFPNCFYGLIETFYYSCWHYGLRTLLLADLCLQNAFSSKSATLVGWNSVKRWLRAHGIFTSDLAVNGHGKEGFVIPTKSFVKIGITKIFCYNKMFGSINKTFDCCG